MNSSAGRLIPLLFLSSALAIAQTTGGGGTTTGGGTTGGGSTGGGRGTPTGTSGTTGGTRGRTIPPLQEQDQQRPIMLNGRVVYDDGTPPNDRVSIERVCNGKARREAYTDSRGYFSFTIDDRQPMMMMQDASVGAEGLDPALRPGGMQTSLIAPDPSGGRNLNGCELRAVLAGSTSNSIQLTGRRAFDDPNVGTLVLRRMNKVGGSTVSLTSLQAPGNARKAFERGKKELEKQKVDEAKADFVKAVEIFPAYAEAWAELSDIYLKASDFDNAKMASEKAVAADSRFVRPYFTLIVLAAGKEDWKGAVQMSDKLLSLDSYNYPAGYYYNALANYRLHNLDKAEASLKAAKRLDPNMKLPKIGLLMGTIMIDRNDFAGAVTELRAFLDHVPEGADAQFARNALTFAQNHLASAATPK